MGYEKGGRDKVNDYAKTTSLWIWLEQYFTNRKALKQEREVVKERGREKTHCV